MSCYNEFSIAYNYCYNLYYATGNCICDLLGAVAKEKWTKLRECHREAIRRQKKKSGQQAVPAKPWTYQKQMDFLLPFMKNRCTSSNVQRRTTEMAEEEDDEVEKQSQAECSNSILNVSDEPELSVNPPKKLKKSNSSERNTTIEQYLKQSEIRAKKREAERKQIYESKASSQNDALFQFFLSMYNTTKQLPVAYQRKIRNGMFKLVTDTEEQHDLDKASIEDTTSVGANSTNYSNSSTPFSNYDELSLQFPEFFKAGPSSVQNDPPNVYTAL